MKIIVALILAGLCTGCKAQPVCDFTNFGCEKVTPQPGVDGPPLRKAEGPPVLTNSRGERYYPGTPSYVPLIDNCIIAGGIRGECIKALPPEELRKLEAAEAERGAILREQMRARRGHDVFGGRREVPDER